MTYLQQVVFVRFNSSTVLMQPNAIPFFGMWQPLKGAGKRYFGVSSDLYDGFNPVIITILLVSFGFESWYSTCTILQPCLKWSAVNK